MIEMYDALPENAKEFRQVLASTLDGMFAENENLVYLDADLVGAIKTGVLFEKYPERAINCGIGEANMIGVAAGMAANGLVPFTHTFGCFATRRVFDQVFLSVGYANCPVKMIGSDPGICAEMNGGTHMPFEDVAIMRSMPNMVIVEPSDATSLEAMLPQLASNESPCYIRIPRKKKSYIYKNKEDIVVGKANTLVEGTDVTLIATGVMVTEALAAAKLLEAEGISARVVDMHTIKPIDQEAVLEAAQKTGAIVTCENHNLIGGLFSAVSEVVCQSCPCPVEGVGVQDQFGEVGPYDYLKMRFGLTPEDIVVKAKFAISKKN